MNRTASRRDSLEKLPAKFIERIEKIYPASARENIFDLLRGVKKEVSFRINSLKTTRAEILNALKCVGIKVKAVDFYSGVYTLARDDLKRLVRTGVYLDGEIYVQNLSSMLPPFILNPQPDEKVLDIAAAPGSKTTQLAVLMSNRGKIIALEKDEARFEKLLANLRLQGTENVRAYNRDAFGIWREFGEVFDRVLVDAPCSAESRFNIKRPRTYSYWNLIRVRKMAKKQKGLITAAFKCLKPGGRLLYSTCTYSPEENESVVNYLFRKFPDCFNTEKIRFPFKNRISALTQWNGVVFHKSINNCLRIFPAGAMEGFFICLIKKTKALPQLRDGLL